MVSLYFTALYQELFIFIKKFIRNILCNVYTLIFSKIVKFGEPLYHKYLRLWLYTCTYTMYVYMYLNGSERCWSREGLEGMMIPRMGRGLNIVLEGSL